MCLTDVISALFVRCCCCCFPTFFAAALVPSIVKRYLSLEDPRSLPDWLMPAAKWLQMDSGDTDLDVDINVLATCMSGRALALMDDREYRAALDLLLEAQILSPSATTLYNIACCQALMGNPEEAMTSLTSAVDLGYANFPHMLQDEDLASLRGHEGFQKLAAAAGPGVCTAERSRGWALLLP